MFTSVIGTLTTVLPKYFIFGSYVPVLIFSFVNLGLVYLYSAWSRAEIEFWLGKSAALTIAVAFVATVALAYVISAINDFLREFLEGKYIPPGLVTAFCYGERCRREDLGADYQRARRHRFLLAGDVKTWDERLRDAASDATPGAAATAYDPTLLDTLRKQVSDGALNGKPEPLSDDEFTKLHGIIERAVTGVVAELRAVRTRPVCDIESDRRDLLLLIGAIFNSLTQSEYEAGTALYTRFGNDPVKPTRMGNIAAAIQSHSIGRYKMEQTLFFSRLQTLLVKNEDKGYPLVLDAKTQLDFLIACCWCSAVTTAFWAVLLWLFGSSPLTFAVGAGAGFALTVGFYLSASANYLAYAEIVRAAVDVHRFQLLEALDIRLPDSLREERHLWAAMSSLTFSGGDNVEFSYEHLAAKPDGAKP